MKSLRLFLPISLLLIFTACSQLWDSAIEEKPQSHWPEAAPLKSIGTSTVYPYGLVMQKHANSPSVNQSGYFSSTLTETVNKDSFSNQAKKIAIPDYANPENYDNVTYFDSNAPDGGDGSLDSPFNSLEILTEGDIEDNHAYLIKGNSVFMNSRICIYYNNPRSNVYIGSYGEGEMPLICNTDSFENPTENAGGFWFYGKRLAVDGLHLVCANGASYGLLLHMGGEKMTFANSHIEGIRDSNGRYPTYGIKGGCDELIMYNCEFAYVRTDLFYLSTRNEGYQMVSNYFHHCNMGCYEGIYQDGELQTPFDPEDRSTWNYKTGDIIQFESGTPVNSYFANNVFNRGDSPGKFCFIINGGTPLNETGGTIIEYNTFISPLVSFGGAGCYLASNVLFRNNLFLNTDPVNNGSNTGVSALVTWSGYGENFKDNHFINYDKGAETYNVAMDQLGQGHLRFDSITDYQSQLAAEERRGSSLF